MHRVRTWDMTPFELRGRNRTLPIEGGDGSTLALDFASMGSLDSRITFTRSSDATFTNSNGKIAYANANHIRNSTMLVSTQWTQVLGGTGTVTINGDQTVRFNGSGGRATWLQTVGSLASGLSMTFSFRVTSFTNNNLRTTDLFNAGTGFTGQAYWYTDTNGTTHSLTQFELLPKSGTNGLGVYSVTATTNATSGNVIFGADCNAVGRLGDVTITEPQLQYGSVVPRPTYIPNGSTASANTSTARFEYDPITLASRGVLIEGSATNLLQRSNAFNTSPWATNGYTHTTGSTSPHSTESSQRMTVTGSGTLGNLQTTTVTATSLTFSVWWKNGNWTGSTGSSPREIAIRNNTTATNLLRFRIDTPTTTPTAGYITGTSGVSFQNYGNGWYRIVATVTSGITSGNAIGIYIGGLLGSFVGSGEYADWYGAQLESGSGASSYIPTGSSQVTRASETAYIPLTNFGFSTAAGTFLVHYRPMQANIGSGETGTAIATDYANGRWIGINRAYNSTTVNLQSWSSIQSIASGSTTDKSAFTYSDFNGVEVVSNFCVNGSAVSNANMDWDPSLPTNLMIGAAAASSPYTSSSREYLNSCVARVNYWPFVLANATLQSITQ